MLEHQVAADRFLGYEKHAWHFLRKRLPVSEHNDDLFAEIRVMTLEATFKFEPIRGRFETFLYRHLQLKCMEKLRDYWRERRNPDRLIDVSFEEIPMMRCPSVQAEISGLLTKVSDPTRSIIRMAMASNTTELRRAFALRTWRFKVGNILGISGESVAAAVAELRREIPKHISSVEG